MNRSDFLKALLSLPLLSRFRWSEPAGAAIAEMGFDCTGTSTVNSSSTLMEFTWYLPDGSTQTWTYDSDLSTRDEMICYPPKTE